MKKYYKIAFCGLGSIGKRHLRNTVKYLQEHQADFQIDAIRSGLGKELEPELKKYVTDQYSEKDKIPQDYDIIFITNPTSCHRESIEKYKNCTRSMFIEKPIVDCGMYEEMNLPKDLICYVACPLRYTKVLQYVKHEIDCDRAYAVRSICSTYLPGWHPDEDYRKSYSAHKEMGGGVAIDLIHEWDYLVWLFGEPDEVNSIQRKVSALEIDSEDIAVYIGRSDSKVYELHLDYFGKEETRKLEIYLPDKTICADIKKGTVHISGYTEDIMLEEERDDYQMKEIVHFFDIIEEKCENDNDVERALNILKIAQKV